MQSSLETSYVSVLNEVQLLRGEVERLLHVARVHSDMLLMNQSLVYEADFAEDAFIYVSPHAEQLTGFTLEQWHQPSGFSSLMGRCHPDDAVRMKARIDQFQHDPAQSRTGSIWTYRWTDNFNRLHWCRKVFRFFIEPHSQHPRISAYIQDVTELIEITLFRNRWVDLSKDSDHRLGPNGGDQELLRSLLDTSGLGLTQIQRRVLELVLAGMSNKQIASQLHRSIRTVEDHRSRIMRKVGANNSVELVRKILEQRTVRK